MLFWISSYRCVLSFTTFHYNQFSRFLGGKALKISIYPSIITNSCIYFSFYHYDIPVWSTEYSTTSTHFLAIALIFPIGKFKVIKCKSIITSGNVHSYPRSTIGSVRSNSEIYLENVIQNAVDMPCRYRLLSFISIKRLTVKALELNCA